MVDFEDAVVVTVIARPKEWSEVTVDFEDAVIEGSFFRGHGAQPRFACVEFGHEAVTEEEETWGGEGLGPDVGHVVLGVDLVRFDDSFLDHFTNMVETDFDVF